MSLENDRTPLEALVADRQSLMRIFIQPDDQTTRTILLQYMERILFGLHDFLGQHVGITRQIRMEDLACHFTDTRLGRLPQKRLADVITDLIEGIAPRAVNVASPYFVGHMTAAIPFFMVHLKTIVAALNQNVVKQETSKVVSLVEKQVLAKIHRLVYGGPDAFYDYHVQNPHTTLGCFLDDGTLANLSALWAARNKLLGPKEGFRGVESEGVPAAYRAYGIDRCVVLVSRLAHFSLKKAGGVLGIGNENVVSLDLDRHNRIDMACLHRTIRELQDPERRTRILAVVGIAGATETGAVDPLPELAEICRTQGIHFHVDAAWGGPTLLSEKYRHLLAGIQHADSVTIDGHKQFYMPMSCGMVYFKDPMLMDQTAYHAEYVNRPGSLDLGIKSLEGSREATSLILDSALKIMGARGYALLLEHGIETAREFAAEIERRENFELMTPPILNILTYRICPPHLRQALEAASPAEREEIDTRLDKINRTVQRLQREAGRSFVSRTTLPPNSVRTGHRRVLRAVLMNPMTNMKILKEILDEQTEIFRCNFTR